MNTDPRFSAETVATPPRSGITLAWLVVAQIGALLTLVPWLYGAALSALQLQSNDSAAGRGLPIAILLYPIVPLVCSIAAWRWYRAGRNAAAAVAMPLPLILALIALYLLFGTAGR